MLARSPVPTPSTNPSPRSSFLNVHYAPAPSSRQSSPRVPAVAKSCRLSNSSPAAPRALPFVPPPKRYVAVDAATQYSPMEQMDYATGAVLPRVPQPDIESNARQPGSQTEEMAVPDERTATAAQPWTGPLQQASTSLTHPIQSPSQSKISSPFKRRNSQGPGNSSSAAPTDAAQNPSTISKRARPETAPPKYLPLRYELCLAEDIVVLIAHMLGELIETNDTLALKSGHLTRFHSRYASSETPGFATTNVTNSTYLGRRREYQCSTTSTASRSTPR